MDDRLQEFLERQIRRDYPERVSAVDWDNLIDWLDRVQSIENLGDAMAADEEGWLADTLREYIEDRFAE